MGTYGCLDRMLGPCRSSAGLPLCTRQADASGPVGRWTTSVRENAGMRAARLTVAGSEPRFELHELADPVAAAGEVVVELP
jgi:hypothetical protein